MLYCLGKFIVVVVNKVDNIGCSEFIYEFYGFGFGDFIGVFGSYGMGIGDLLDVIVEKLFDFEEEIYDEDVICVVLIGCLNVGKFLLVNVILGEECVIVSDVVGMMCDVIDILFEKDGQCYVLIDIVGMCKCGKVYEIIEKYSVMCVMCVIECVDVVLIVINGEEGIIEQDKYIVGYVFEVGKVFLFVVNKWDVVDKIDKMMNEFEKKIWDYFLFMIYVFVVFLLVKIK